MILILGGSVAAGQAHRGCGERRALPRLKGVSSVHGVLIILYCRGYNRVHLKHNAIFPRPHPHKTLPTCPESRG
jgi:hypothetical protein